jgi:hypothetical protein
MIIFSSRRLLENEHKAILQGLIHLTADYHCFFFCDVSDVLYHHEGQISENMHHSTDRSGSVDKNGYSISASSTPHHCFESFVCSLLVDRRPEK